MLLNKALDKIGNIGPVISQICVSFFDYMFRKTVPLGYINGMTFSGNSHQYPIGRAQCVLIKFDRGIYTGVLTIAVIF